MLTNGKVLIAGGQNSASSYLNGAELYDPTTGVWTATGNTNNARSWHTASILANGTVLIAGGYNGGYMNSAELYNPSTGIWTVTGSMNYARMQHPY